MYDKLQETIMKENAAWIAARPDIPGKEDAMRNIELYIKIFKHKLHTCAKAWELREKRRGFVPVIVKDGRSDIPYVEYDKMLVHGELPLGEYIYFIRTWIGWLNIDTIDKPTFVSFKNIEPPIGALMSEVDEQNKDEDGFLHVTYGGEGKAHGTINHEQ
ncbi:autophagy-related protein 8g-like [Malus sylvestris]|uniref:Autophagy-related protein n=1 Tax=Malus domestica TaxID=3750 RepID=A0A498IV96_MALDO|nr:autophagy-related protein 8g-like [Malus sylvestris]RXH86097.1 hypothetical protein DVH24_017150 [Malus domestica]